MTIPEIEDIDSHRFEDIVEELIRKMGFITEERKIGADGGIDILAHNEEPLLKGTYIIQCKRYTGNIGAPLIRDLYGVVHARNANKGILITNSDFTQ
jgi:restriction system protein